MKTITAQTGQTLFDIALQTMGDVLGAFDILNMNAFLRLDMSIPAGTKVFVPDTVINPQVVDYYTRNNIVPASGLGEEVTLNIEDMINIVQTLNYQIGYGDKAFDGVRLWNLKDILTVQVNYSNISGLPGFMPTSTTGVHIYIEQSLDGELYSPVADATCVLDPALLSHTFNIEGLQTNYVRARFTRDNGDLTGTIDEIIFRT